MLKFIAFEKMHQSDQIESYLKNELSTTDQAIFEEMLRRDPLLKNEVRFQEAVVGEIQQFRKNQLKARLNQINIDSSTSSSNYKVAAVALAGLLTVGTVGWYVADHTKNQDSVVQNTTHGRSETKQEVAKNSNVPQLKEAESKESIIKEDKLPVEKSTEINIPQAKNEVSKPLMVEPDSMENPEDLQKHDQIKLPTGDIAPVSTKENLGVKVSVNNSTAYKFHYSFTDTKLFLYGDFNQLYEILDFNTKEGKQLYLYYQSNFYKISENQTNIAPLTKVNDPSMIKKLKEAREQSQK